MTSSVEERPDKRPTQNALSEAGGVPAVLSVEPSVKTPSVELGPSYPRWRLVRRCLLGLLIAALLFVLYRGADFAYHGWGVYQEAKSLQALLLDSDAGDEIDVAELSQMLEAMAVGVEQLDQRMGFFAPIVQRLSWIPDYGPTIAQGPELLSAGSAGLRLSSNALSTLQPALGNSLHLSSIEPDILFDLLETAASSAGEFDALAGNADLLAEKIQAIDPAAVDPRVGRYLTLAEPYLPFFSPLVRLAPFGQELLGMDGPRTYLLLVQNNHELRPTGGFLTAVGHVVVDGGKIARLDFSDSSQISRDGEHPPAPEPLRRYMGIQILLLRDANWSPDLPTAAQMIKSLYAADTGQAVDGVITIDLRSTELLVNALGSLEIDGAEEPLTGETLLEQIFQFWSKPLDTGDTLAEDGLGRWWGQRKDFMPKLANAALAKIQSGNVDYEQIALAVLTALNERSIQLWIDDATVAEELAALGWDGALRPPEEGDFLALVDSNLGFNKVDYLLKRSLDYEIEWPRNPQQPGQATVTVRYEHPTPLDGHTCDIAPRYSDTYEDSAAQRCYFNYVRLYVPKGSQLEGIDGVETESVSTRRGEAGLQLFAGYFVLKPGETNEVMFRYTLPPHLNAENYRLLIQRQAGTMPLPITGAFGDIQIETTLKNGRFHWPPEAVE